MSGSQPSALDLLSIIVYEIQVTNRLLNRILNQEYKMADAITQAFIDVDTEIATIGTDISDLVARLANAPPGADANAIAAQIETRLTALKSVADPLKSIAVTAAPTPLVSDTPVATPAPTEPAPAAETPPTPTEPPPTT